MPQECLDPEALMAKLDFVLTATARYVRQIPQAELAGLPLRGKAWDVD